MFFYFPQPRQGGKSLEIIKMNCCASLTPLAHLNHKIYKQSVSAIGVKNKFMDSSQPGSCMGARNDSLYIRLYMFIWKWQKKS
jgi:hypothetical protein